MIIPVPFNEIRDLIDPVYTKGHGYVCFLTIEALRLIEANSVKIIINGLIIVFISDPLSSSVVFPAKAGNQSQ